MIITFYYHNYVPDEYLGFSTVGNVNLIFPSGSCGSSITKENITLASVWGGRLPRVHWNISPTLSSSLSSIAVEPLFMASSYVSLA